MAVKHVKRLQNRTTIPTPPRLACRLMILCLLASIRACDWMVEQPSSSTFVHFPYLRYLKTVFKNNIPIEMERLFGSQGLFLFKFLTTSSCLIWWWLYLLSWMGLFGARSPKLTVVIGTPSGTHTAWVILISWNQFESQILYIMFSSSWSLSLHPRSWMSKLYQPLTKSLKKKLKLSSKGVVIKTTLKNGKTSVHRPQANQYTVHVCKGFIHFHAILWGKEALSYEVHKFILRSLVKLLLVYTQSKWLKSQWTSKSVYDLQIYVCSRCLL